MRPDVQRQFAERVTDETYASMRASLDEWLAYTIQFRVCEMPIFVSHDVRRELEQASVDILMQCTGQAYMRNTDATITPEYCVPRENDRPLFSVVDFAVCLNDSGNFVPKLIELQGFPSLFGYQYLLASRFREQYELWDTTPFFSDIDHDQYLNILRTAIFADEDPELVALIEIDPDQQKTRPDFIATEKLLGLRTVNIRDIRVEGRGLTMPMPQGGTKPLRRIFNRAIVDELTDMGVELPFRWTDDLDVAWAGHPNWYFRISKFSLPYLQHAAVPQTSFLHTLTELPANLERYVLKPLFSFAGKGVVVGPTEADIEAIRPENRSNWVLQERVEYTPCVYTPLGNNKVEIRVMLIWLPDMERPLPVMSLARTGRGALMGARYNVEPWTGSTGCLFV